MSLLFAPGVAWLVAAAIFIIPYSEGIIFRHTNIPPDQLKSSFSMIIALLGSSLAWLRSSYNDHDKNSNFTAAGLSGVAAIFSISTISFSDHLKNNSPDLVMMIIKYGYGAGWFLLIVIISQSTWRYFTIRANPETIDAQASAIATCKLISNLGRSLIDNEIMSRAQAATILRMSEDDAVRLTPSKADTIRRIIRDIEGRWQ